MKKPNPGPAAQHALVWPIPLSHPRVSADHRAAHAEARPSRPAAHNGGKPTREGNDARAPSNDSVFATSSTVLFR